MTPEPEAAAVPAAPLVAVATTPSAPTPPSMTTAPDSRLRPEASARALLTGCGIGAVLAAGNVYTGLKTTMIDGGSITAALLGFSLFAVFKRRARTPYTALENNITQTTAASAAIMGYVVGVGGPIPGLALMGRSFPGWAVAVFGTAIGLLGIAAAAVLRRKLVVADTLPFPTGAATAEVIESMYAERRTALRRARLLIGGAAIAMAVTWLRDGRPQIIPQATALGFAIAGVSAGSLTLGMSWSPLMMATGVMMGLRIALSMLLGGVVAWAVIAPWLVKSGVVAAAGFGPCSAWLVWPGLGLLLAGSFVPLLLDWRGVLRSFGDLTAIARRRAGVGAPAAAGDGQPRALAPLLLLGVAALGVLGRHSFGLSLWMIAVGLVLALVLANISGRAAGETDLAPVGAVGMLTQLSFAGYGPMVSIVAGWISMGTSSQTSQTLWAFKAGRRLGATPRAQLGAQITGALIGGAIVVPVYWVIVKSYGLATEAMPAASAVSWRATAEAVRGGLAALPPHGPLAGALGLGLGVALSLLGRGRYGRFLPSPAAMGVAMINPASFSIAATVGALAAFSARRARPSLTEHSIMAFAAGGIAGESIMGVIIAILIATGRL